MQAVMGGYRGAWSAEGILESNTDALGGVVFLCSPMMACASPHAELWAVHLHAGSGHLHLYVHTLAGSAASRLGN